MIVEARDITVEAARRGLTVLRTEARVVPEPPSASAVEG
jgi:hypothetical protein